MADGITVLFSNGEPWALGESKPSRAPSSNNLNSPLAQQAKRLSSSSPTAANGEVVQVLFTGEGRLSQRDWLVGGTIRQRVDSTTLTYSLTGDPIDGASLNASTGEWTFDTHTRPTTQWLLVIKVIKVGFTVSDEQGASTRWWCIALTGANDARVATFSAAQSAEERHRAEHRCCRQ